MKPGFQVSCSIRESSVPGIGQGVFAEEFIPAGTLVWKYARGINVHIYRDASEVRQRLSELEPQDQRFFMTHVYMVGGVLNEILDDARMWNHSDAPNTGYGPDGADSDFFSSYASRDIEAGEELFDDYGRYEYPAYFVELAREYNVPLDFFTVKTVPAGRSRT